MSRVRIRKQPPIPPGEHSGTFLSTQEIHRNGHHYRQYLFEILVGGIRHAVRAFTPPDPSDPECVAFIEKLMGEQYGCDVEIEVDLDEVIGDRFLVTVEPNPRKPWFSLVTDVRRMDDDQDD